MKLLTLMTDCMDITIHHPLKWEAHLWILSARRAAIAFLHY